jgi:hypothetical protein
MALLLNIDKPHRTCTLHSPACSMVPKPHGSVHKPVGSLGRDGGWFDAVSEAAACAIAAREFAAGEFGLCGYCQEQQQ